MKYLLASAVLGCLFLVSCGDSPGYSFGVYDEQVAELMPLVDRFCARAEFCQIGAFGDYDGCRLWLGVNSVEDSLSSQACELAWTALVECVESSPCIDFPALGDSGACASLSDSAFNECAAVQP